MNLIGSIHVAHEHPCILVETIVVHQFNSILGTLLMGVTPVGITVLSLLYPLEITSVVLELGVLHVLDGLCGIHTYCCANSLSVTGLGPTLYELSVHIEGQMIVQERRTQIHTGSQTLVVTALEDALLTCVTHAHAIWHSKDRLILSLHATLQGDVMVVVHACTVDFVLPIGIVCTKLLQGIALGIALLPAKQIPCLATLAIVVGDEVNIFLCIHHVESIEIG